MIILLKYVSFMIVNLLVMFVNPRATDICNSIINMRPSIATIVKRIEIPIDKRSNTKEKSPYNKDAMIYTIQTHITDTNKNIDDITAGCYAYYIYDAALKWKIHPLLITALIHCESTFNNTSINKTTGAIGLTQIHWKYHSKAIMSSFSGITKREDLLKPRNSIFAGTWIFWCYLKSSKYNKNTALYRYCCNDGYVNKVLSMEKKLYARYNRSLVLVAKSN